MKKIFKFLIVIGILVSLIGCGSSKTPEEYIKAVGSAKIKNVEIINETLELLVEFELVPGRTLKESTEYNISNLAMTIDTLKKQKEKELPSIQNVKVTFEMLLTSQNNEKMMALKFEIPYKNYIGLGKVPDVMYGDMENVYSDDHSFLFDFDVWRKQATHEAKK